MLPNFKINSDFTYLDALKIAKNSNSLRLYKKEEKNKKKISGRVLSQPYKFTQAALGTLMTFSMSKHVVPE